MRKCFAITALMLALISPAIAGNQTSLGELKANGYESILATKDQTPRFTFHAPKGLVPSHFLGGVVGLVMHAKAADRGSEILTEYKVTEPAIDIAKGLAAHLGEPLQLASDFKDSGLASSMAATHVSLRGAKDLAHEYGPG